MSSVIKKSRITQRKSIHIEEPRPVIAEEKGPDLKDQIDIQKLYEKAKLEREQVVLEAQVKAQTIIEEASKKSQELLESTHKEISDKMEIALNEQQKIIEAANGKAQTILKEAEKEKERILNQAEPEIIQLVQHLVTYIVDEEVTKHTEWVRLLVLKMLSQEQLLEDFRVEVSINVYEKMTPKEHQWFEERGIAYEGNENLNDTTCMIITSQGNLVYDISLGLEKVLKEIDILQKV